MGEKKTRKQKQFNLTSCLELDKCRQKKESSAEQSFALQQTKVDVIVWWYVTTHSCSLWTNWLAAEQHKTKNRHEVLRSSCDAHHAGMEEAVHQLWGESTSPRTRQELFQWKRLRNELHIVIINIHKSRKHPKWMCGARNICLSLSCWF